mmetsp:Transcript_12445/g.44765  ORF Transcript_12445/g.44765 Transcript_12445/m.44765 type:complete len:625 (+) Transcript_12445:108-1982(+)
MIGYNDTGWPSLGLDRGILRALAKKKFKCPTAVQSRAIPLVLAGKDVLARAHTGSGKTAAYLLPAIHKIMQCSDSKTKSNPRVLILVPTHELAQQVMKEAVSFLVECAPTLRAGELTCSGSADVLPRNFAGVPPEILVSTPSRVAACIRGGKFPPRALNSGLEFFVLDEADLLLSFGYEDDIRCIADATERGCQCMLVSATSPDDLSKLKAIVLHNPVNVDIALENNFVSGRVKEEQVTTGKSAVMPLISHYALEILEKDKLLYCMALLRLGLCKKKSLVFVSSPDAAVRLRLFLHKFGIPCCVLHEELPANSRAHILHEFNRGVYDYMIAAADDLSSSISVVNDDNKDVPVKEVFESKAESTDVTDCSLSKRSKFTKHTKRKRNAMSHAQTEFGVVRGIDFKDVHTVLNLDVPISASDYIHRVGRTGRAGQPGTAITLTTPKNARALEDMLSRHSVSRHDTRSAIALMPYKMLRREAVEALRYRAEDAARAVGRTAVREARLRELRAELLNSERLAAHFDGNPTDLALLKRASCLISHQEQPHLCHLPSYIRSQKVTCSSAKTGKKNKHTEGEKLTDETTDEIHDDHDEPSEYLKKRKTSRSKDFAHKSSNPSSKNLSWKGAN